MERTCALPGCEVVVTGRRQTCSASHRQAWGRLRKRTAASRDRVGQGITKPADAATKAAAADPVALAIEVFKQELSPHVREAITEDTIRAIRSLVTLTPQLVESLGNDLLSGDAVARGRAQALVAKYTLGFLDPEREANSRPLVIQMGAMPVPGGDANAGHNSETDTVQQCDRCEDAKTLDHFEPGATRCNECQAEIREAIQAKYT